MIVVVVWNGLLQQNILQQGVPPVDVVQGSTLTAMLQASVIFGIANGQIFVNVYDDRNFT